MFVVYALIDPRDQATRYIGITQDVYARYRQHIRCDSCNPEKDAWITSLQEAQVMVIMQSLEYVATLEQALEREQYWIQHHLHLHASLVNMSGIPGRVVRTPSIPRTRCISQTSEPLPSNSIGRARKSADIISLLTSVRETGAWPDTVSLQMRRYYKREYPEYFSNNRKSRKLRTAR